MTLRQTFGILLSENNNDLQSFSPLRQAKDVWNCRWYYCKTIPLQAVYIYLTVFFNFCKNCMIYILRNCFTHLRTYWSILLLPYELPPYFPSIVVLHLLVEGHRDLAYLEDLGYYKRYSQIDVLYSQNLGQCRPQSNLVEE